MLNAVGRFPTVAAGVCLPIPSRGLCACHLPLRKLLSEPKNATTPSPSHSASPSRLRPAARPEKRLCPAPLNCPPPKCYRTDSFLESFSKRYRTRFGGAGALMWFATFARNRSEANRTRRKPNFSSMETPAGALTMRRRSFLRNVVAKARDCGLTRRTRCPQGVNFFRIFRTLSRFKIEVEAARN